MTAARVEPHFTLGLFMHGASSKQSSITKCHVSPVPHLQWKVKLVLRHTTDSSV